jgi:hypothetical protein
MSEVDKYFAMDGYPHEYDPNKPVKSIEVLKRFPDFKIGCRYLVLSGGSTGDYIHGDYGKIKLPIDDCLDFPEFFKPHQ